MINYFQQKESKCTILDIDNRELQKQETQEVELNDRESKVKRTESEEERNDFKTGSKRSS